MQIPQMNVFVLGERERERESQEHEREREREQERDNDAFEEMKSRMLILSCL